MPSSISEFLDQFTEYPVRSATDDVTKPSPIGLPIDDNAIDEISSLDLAAYKATLNSLNVEELFNDAVSRINNCLTLRERAQDIQFRMLNEAMSIHGDQNIHSIHRQVEALAAIASGADPKTVETINRTVAEATKLIHDTRVARAKAVGHGANFLSRFASLKAMYSANFREAYARANLSSDALKAIYGIVSPLPKITRNGFLDQLAEWAQVTSNLLDVELSQRRKIRVAIALNSQNETLGLQLFLRSQYFAALSAGVLSFDTTSVLTQMGLKQPLLRSLSFQVVTAPAVTGTFWNLVVTPPPHSLASGGISLRMVGVSGDAAQAGEFATSEFHNIVPAGQWLINWDSRLVTGETEMVDNITNIILHMVVSVRVR